MESTKYLIWAYNHHKSKKMRIHVASRKIQILAKKLLMRNIKQTKEYDEEIKESKKTQQRVNITQSNEV